MFSPVLAHTILIKEESPVIGLRAHVAAMLEDYSDTLTRGVSFYSDFWRTRFPFSVVEWGNFLVYICLVPNSFSTEKVFRHLDCLAEDMKTATHCSHMVVHFAC